MRQIQRKIYSDEIKYGFGLYSIMSIMKDFELSKKKYLNRIVTEDFDNYRRPVSDQWIILIL